MDIQLGGRYPKQAAHVAAVLALQCLNEAKARPSMTEVLATLEQINNEAVENNNCNHNNTNNVVA